MQILDINNNIINKVTADLDNEYYFSKMWPGKYKLRIEPLYLKNKSLTSEPKYISLELNGTDEYFTVDDFILSPSIRDTFISSGENEVNTKATQLKILNTKEITAPLLNSSDEISSVKTKLKTLNTTSLSYVGNQNISALKSAIFSIQVGAYSELSYCIEKVDELKKLRITNVFSKQINNLCKVYIGQYNDENTALTESDNLPKK